MSAQLVIRSFPRSSLHRVFAHDIPQSNIRRAPTVSPATLRSDFHLVVTLTGIACSPGSRAPSPPTITPRCLSTFEAPQNSSPPTVAPRCLTPASLPTYRRASRNLHSHLPRHTAEVPSTRSPLQRLTRCTHSFVSATSMEAAPALDGHSSAPATAARIAVVGAGISGLVAASILAERGAHVAVFDLGRGPGGRMSQRRESIAVSPRVSSAKPAVDLPNLEARFDHGAQYFTISDPNVLTFLEQRFGGAGTGALAEWKGRFGVWDAEKGKFIPEGGEDAGKVQEGGNFGIKKRFVGVPGMNALCQTLLLPSPMASAVNINARFGVQVARADWLEHKSSAGVSEVDEGTPLPPSWELFSSFGDSLGCFHGLVIAAAYRTMPVVLPDLPSLAQVRQGLAEVRASPRFAMMLAFAEPLSHVAFDGVDVVGSDVVGWIGRDSSKPGRARRDGGQDRANQSKAEVGYQEEQYAECWVVHSTAHYASSLLASAPPGRPSPDLLARVADDMWRAVKPILGSGSGRGGGQSVGGVEGEEELEPVLRKVHRWGGAFPVAGVAPAGDKCLWSEGGRVAACGDFCVGGPTRGLVEGAVASGMEAGRKVGDALRLGRSAL